MEDSSFMEDAEGLQLYEDAKYLFDNGDHIKALEIIEDLILVHRDDKNAWILHLKQGQMFNELAKKTENPDVEFAYLLGSVECFSEDGSLSPLCAKSLITLARKLGSVLYYKKSLEKAKQGLSVTTLPHKSDSVAQLSLQDQRELDKKNKGLLSLIKEAESEIASSKSLVASTIKNSEQKVWESKETSDPPEDAVKGLRSYWVGLDVKIKRDFMKVSIAKLTSFVEGEEHYKEGREVLEHVLASAREARRWTAWMCRTLCSKEFSSAEECKNHLEQQHAADFKPSSEKYMVKRIGKDWARKILVGGWEPVDAVAAVEMIKNQLADVKAFASKAKNGWSKEWPLAVDEERSKLLKEIKLLLFSFCNLKILSGSIRDWMMRFPAKYLGKLEVSEQSLVDSRLVETPQSICFLESHELTQILDFLNNIKCERNDGTNLVCRAVESVLSRTRVKEKIDLDPQFSYLLLDRRLLKSNNIPFDDEGTVNIFDPSVHYAKAQVHGDDIISWFTDYSSVDKTFPRPVREHNFGIWVAVLKAVQFTCRNLGTKYAKKVLLLDYAAALTVVENTCMSEDERRRNLPEDQWSRYASLLCDMCEERVPKNSLTTKLFMCAVRDVFEGALHPTFDFLELEDSLNLIREHKSLSDDKVLQAIDLLKSVVTQKVLLIDTKILLIDNSRISLLNNLTRLSAFDNRTYILQVLKPFLLNEIVNMESKAKSDAAEANLLNELEKEKQQSKEKPPSKKKRDKSKKKTSTSNPSTLDKTVEHLEPESTSLSLRTVEENSMEPEDALASETGRLEISSKNEIQEEATEDEPDMHREDSLSEHLEPAAGEVTTRYNSALDMTLKALLNIKIFKEDLMKNRQPFQDHGEEQVPSALQNLFDAFVSEVIRNEGVYSCLLSDLLTSQEEFLSMSSDAAKVVVAVLNSWRCWKNPERESLVTRMFTLADIKRMSCRKCRRITNFPVQSCYGIVMAADSIRELKCAFGNIKFVDILKLIRMGYKTLCDNKTGGCGKKSYVHHIIRRCPPIFTIVLEWEKSETEKQISETTKALDWEIDISRLYEGGVEPNTNYRLVSMVGCGEGEEEHICLAYEKNRWVNLRRECLAGEDVGNWKSVVRFCGERKVRPEILIYEAVRLMT
ncbi:hypothetical protein ISN44_As13g025620 [Arabidopsis suecica]|uniref:C2H2-type domain-containing protein n=1 Tax=Arabidopsis suecica TaxID=45249 RepID=A0A8T1Y140_ARASU|nr:hypothetical protein ISN44_As13g025620 [Arabidopsis suecica]